MHPSLAAILLLSLPIIAGTIPAGRVATGRGFSITNAELEEKTRIAVFRLAYRQYETQRTVLDEMVGERLVSAEASEQSLSPESLVERELAARVKAVDPEDVEVAYEKAKTRFPTLTEDELKEKILESIIGARRQSARKEYFAELRAKYEVKYRLVPPRLLFEEPSFAATEGPRSAPVAVLVFSDFSCPGCRGLSATLSQLRARYKEDVRWILVHFPAKSRPLASFGARSAYCVGAAFQWRFFDAVFDSEPILTEESFKTAAHRLDVPAEKFEACLSNEATNRAVDEHVAFGKSLGVSGTPTIFVNGRMILGSPPAREMDSILREELEAAGRSTRRER